MLYVTGIFDAVSYAKVLGYEYYDVLVIKDKMVNKKYNSSGKALIKYLKLVTCIYDFLVKDNNAINRNAIISVEQVIRKQEDINFSYHVATKNFKCSLASFGEGIRKELEEYIYSAKRVM